jgi:hypothetical protein
MNARSACVRRLLCAGAAVAAFALAGAGGAAAATEPLTVFVPSPPPPPFGKGGPPPTEYLSGPCGLAVDPFARLYIADYYHDAIDVYAPNFALFSQITEVDPGDGPCGMAIPKSGGALYVNDYHRDVVKSPPAGQVFDSAEPTGIAVDASGNVFVDGRDHVAEYNSGGALIQTIGLGTLGDGYGIAVSGYPGTAGRVYVPDAASNTVRAYDPLVSTVTPVAEIKNPFNKPFTSLRDSAIAVDDASGDVYVVDNTQPAHTERPQATVYIYGSTGTYKGHLKYNVIDALQPGLAVDNSEEPSQGRVYVTSGNSNQAGVYAYGPGSGTFSSPQPPTFSLAVASVGPGAGMIAAPVARLSCAGSCEEELLAGGDVPLTAEPAPGSEFAGWSGAGCADEGATCTVTMSEAESVVARFAPASPQEGGQAPEAAPVPALDAPRASAGSPRTHSHRRHRRHRRHHRHRHDRRHLHRRHADARP